VFAVTHASTSPKTRPFNSPLEYGLRLLFVLDAAAGAVCDLQRLIAYDYLLVHSGDVEEGPTSLHPPVPFRGGELLVKRDVLAAGLDQMVSKELLNRTFDSEGVGYSANALTRAFIDLLKNDYAADLKWRADWVVKRFGALPAAALSAYMDDNVGRWGAEFERLSALNDLEL